MTTRSAKLEQLAADIRQCTRCPLYKTAIQGVPGDGPVTAKIMLIGEAPGQQEDKQGHPFVGASGKFLDTLLASIGLERSDIFITNVVKHRPPNNRDPLPLEIEACRPWLEEQINLIQPQVIVTISRFAMARWFPGEKISDIHGTAKKIGSAVVVPMYHPAVALYNPQMRQVLLQDFEKLRKYLKPKRKQQKGKSTSSDTKEA